MTLQALADQLYRQLDLPARMEARDMQTILKALKEAQAITEHGAPLDALMNNVLAWRLGEIAEQAGCCRKGVGDHIDRGLILLRLLNEKGFLLYKSAQAKTEEEEMIRKILCPACATKSRPQHPEDVVAGWKVRYTVGHAQKPAEHRVVISSASGSEQIDLPSLVCDNCGDDLPDGASVTAVTYWRGEEPLRWEEEYMK